MEKIFPLEELGNKVRNIRKANKMNQIDFYRNLYPDKELEEENIKKKMNALENGKMKTVNFDFLLRLHYQYDVSIDYLLGFETEYKSYENRAASIYTGLSPDAVAQLHEWSVHKNLDISDYSIDQQKARNKMLKIEGEWLLQTISKLLDSSKDYQENGDYSNYSILYDMYMLANDKPQHLVGLSLEDDQKCLSIFEKLRYTISLSPDSLSYSDSMNGVHSIDLTKLSNRYWKDKLMEDMDTFIDNLKTIEENDTSPNDC